MPATPSGRRRADRSRNTSSRTVTLSFPSPTGRQTGSSSGSGSRFSAGHTRRGSSPRSARNDSRHYLAGRGAPRTISGKRVSAISRRTSRLTAMLQCRSEVHVGRRLPARSLGQHSESRLRQGNTAASPQATAPRATRMELERKGLPLESWPQPTTALRQGSPSHRRSSGLRGRRRLPTRIMGHRSAGRKESRATETRTRGPTLGGAWLDLESPCRKVGRGIRAPTSVCRNIP